MTTPTAIRGSDDLVAVLNAEPPARRTKEHPMRYIAYATTKENTIGADPGITVKDEDTYTLAGEWELPEAPLDGPPRLTPGGYLDTEHADRLLACSGWERSGDWRPSGGQWAAELRDPDEPDD